MLFAYARVSTVEQAAEDKASITSQLKTCRAVAEMRGETGKYKYAEYSDKGVSGSVPLYLRPAGRTLVSVAERGDIIIAAKLDRIFRSGADALNTVERFKKKGIDLIICDFGIEPLGTGPVSGFFFGLMSLVAQFERERIAERIAEGKAAKLARGGFIGGAVPFGYKKIGTGKTTILVRDEKEQEAIKLARKLANEMPRNSQQVARLMARDGYLGRDGQLYSPKAIARMLEPRPLRGMDLLKQTVKEIQELQT